MANIKSAKKRILVNQTKADRNKAIRSAVKTSMKKVDAAVAANDKEAAAAAHEKMVEAAVEADDDCMMRYLEGEEISDEEIMKLSLIHI